MSVVVVCRDELVHIEGCLEALLGQTPGVAFEIIAVDGDSTDGTRETIERLIKRDSRLRLVENPDRLIAPGRNRGVVAARHELVAFTDADCLAPRAWLRTLLEGYQRLRRSDPALVAVGGGNRVPRRAGRFARAVGIARSNFWGHHGSVQGRAFAGATHVGHLPTVNALYEKRAILEVGGFDESFGNIAEDVDLSLRLAAQGLRFAYLPDCDVEHRVVTGPREWLGKMLIYGRGRAWILAKHGVRRRGHLRFLLPPLLVLYLAAVIAAGLLHRAAIGPGFGSPLLWAPGAIYLGATTVAALHAGLRARAPRSIPVVAVAYLMTHLAYGVGELSGLVRRRPARSSIGRHSAPPLPAPRGRLEPRGRPEPQGLPAPRRRSAAFTDPAIVSTPFVSILLTVRNAGATLRACLDSLVALDYSPDRYEIVVVDGGSRDGTLAILRDFEARLERAGRARAPAPRFLLLEAAGNIPHGRNAGLQHCRGEFVAVTDGDVIAPAPWLKELVAAAADGVAAVGGPNNTARSDLWSRAVACIPVHGPTLDEVPPFGPPRFAAGFVTDRWVYAAVTRNCLFRREVITGAGGFDPAFERTEDVELNARLLEAGHRLAYTPRAGVLHHHRSTLAGFIRQQWGYARWQAVANAKHAGLSHPKHRLPPLALGTLALSALAAAWRPALWPLPAALVTTGAIGAAAYGWRCALLKRDPGLVAAIPPAFAAWMLAWAIGYPWGMWRRRKVLAGGYR